jgi:hypothetical protein
MAMQNRLILDIEECNRILLDHYNDLSLYDDLISVWEIWSPFGSNGRARTKNKKQKPFLKPN